MNNMKELQHIISKWSIEDLNMVLRFSNGDCERAINKILQHERTGLPAELLICSLGNDVAPYDGQWQQQQTDGRKLSPSITGMSRTKDGGSLQSFNHEMAAHSSPYAAATMTTKIPPRSFHDVERHNDRPSALSGQASRSFRDRNTVPPIIQAKARSYEGGRHRKGPSSIPQEPGQPSRRGPPSDDTASISSLNSYPEALLQRLSPNEKDRLLRQLLSFRGQLGRHGMPEKARIPNNKTDMSTKELDLLNVQTGILMSFKEEEKALKPRSEDMDDEAIKFGIRASKREFRELCRRQDEEEKMEMEKALIDTAKFASLHDHTPMSREECIIEEVKRESLACPGFFSQEESLIEEAKRESLVSTSSMPKEEHVIEEVKRESLECPPPMTREKRLIEEVKRESLATMQALAESQSLPVENHDIQEVPSTWRLRGTRMPSLATAAFPFTGDVASIWSMEVHRCMTVEDASSSSVLDRKPAAQDQTQVDDAPIPRAILHGEFSMPLGGLFGGYNALT